MGLIYVPELPVDDTCLSDTRDLIPSNATRLTDLPAQNCAKIALAPWTSAACAKSYLAQANQDQTLAMLFYLPGTSAAKPLPADAPLWDLDDNDEWKSENEFPVYAIPGESGDNLMRQLSLYSGNLSEAPQADRLMRFYDVNSIPRVYGLVGLGMFYLKIELSVDSVDS